MYKKTFYPFLVNAFLQKDVYQKDKKLKKMFHL